MKTIFACCSQPGLCETVSTTAVIKVTNVYHWCFPAMFLCIKRYILYSSFGSVTSLSHFTTTSLDHYTVTQFTHIQHYAVILEDLYATIQACHCTNSTLLNHLHHWIWKPLHRYTITLLYYCITTQSTPIVLFRHCTLHHRITTLLLHLNSYKYRTNIPPVCYNFTCTTTPFNSCTSTHHCASQFNYY